ncbi:lipopolysaccharide assembly protein LapA domain-containing protein [Serpens gallinarum]|uniref:LapA family protein n=1 Tax=Serpens gallinarum TaxID=2763075 RepID=A0ABR8TQX3_9PSED|nr:LapA family protein [Serpens gallinarum]
MNIIRRILVGVAALLAGLFIVIFILENRQLVALTLFGQSTAMLPLATFLVLSFLAGLLVGPLLSSIGLARLRMRLRNTRREMSACQRQLAQQLSQDK